jgi:hypothetical protein
VVARTPPLGRTGASPGSEAPGSGRSVRSKAGLAQKLIRASKRFLRGVVSDPISPRDQFSILPRAE